MQPIAIQIVELITGVLLLFGGGELFVQGSVALALLLRVPQLVIGLTVVSLGTSAPELFVSAGSFLRGSDALAISNVVGSNIFNIMVVLGSSALILPLHVESRLVRRDVPILLVISSTVWAISTSGKIPWTTGLALLITLIINTIWEIRTANKEPQKTQEAEPKIKTDKDSKSLIDTVSRLIIGIMLLAIGSKLLVSGATSIAEFLKIKEEIIGLTIVSAGTSMPELITSLVAAIRGRTDLAIGNVVGSCLLNQLLVLGTCSLISGAAGIAVDQLLIQQDLPVMVLATLSCMPIFWTKGIISRGEGGTLVGLYMIYLADKIIPLTFPPLHHSFRLIVSIIMVIGVLIISMKSYRYWLKTKNLPTIKQ